MSPGTGLTRAGCAFPQLSSRILVYGFIYQFRDRICPHGYEVPDTAVPYRIYLSQTRGTRPGPGHGHARATRNPANSCDGERRHIDTYTSVSLSALRAYALASTLSLASTPALALTVGFAEAVAFVVAVASAAASAAA